MKEKLIGIFVEPRKVKQIFYNIENFFEILPNTPLYFFCGKNLKHYFEDKLNKFPLLIIRELSVNNLNALTYSDLFKSISFWEEINSEYILTIQTDGCLCCKSPYKIEDFFKYDYIGGYAFQNWWNKAVKFNSLENIKMCFNGGISLRNLEKMKEVLKIYPPKPTQKISINFEDYPEVLYFVIGMIKLNYNVGMDNFATKFCTHTYFFEPTFAVHKLYHYLKNNKKNLTDFLKYSPEFKKFLKLDFIE